MPSSRKKPKVTKPKKSKKNFDTRPKNVGVVDEHLRGFPGGGGTISVRQHIRLIAGNRVKSFNVTTKEEADNQEFFSWKGLNDISHLKPMIVEMSPADFLLLTADYSDPEYDPDYELTHPEAFDEKAKESDEQTEKRIKTVDKYAQKFEKMKRTQFVTLTCDTKTGQVWRHSPDSRERVEALKEIGVGSIPVVVVEE